MKNTNTDRAVRHAVHMTGPWQSTARSCNSTGSGVANMMQMPDKAALWSTRSNMPGSTDVLRLRTPRRRFIMAMASLAPPIRSGGKVDPVHYGTSRGVRPAQNGSKRCIGLQPWRASLRSHAFLEESAHEVYGASWACATH